MTYLVAPTLWVHKHKQRLHERRGDRLDHKRTTFVFLLEEAGRTVRIKAHALEAITQLGKRERHAPLGSRVLSHKAEPSRQCVHVTRKKAPPAIIYSRRPS